MKFPSILSTDSPEPSRQNLPFQEKQFLESLLLHQSYLFLIFLLAFVHAAGEIFDGGEMLGLLRSFGFLMLLPLRLVQV